MSRLTPPRRGRSRRTLFPVAVVLLWAASVASAEAKNVILMVSDGAGFNTFAATSMYQHGTVGGQPYEQAGWARYACTTYPLHREESPHGTGAQDPNVVYDPNKAWDTTGDGVGPFAGYTYLKTTYTDSAAAATALATGQKTYDGAINWSDLNAAITPTIVERAESAGKVTGTISSVEFSHATPAGLSNAHNASRGNYADLANQMLDGPMEVIMGCGHPEFDDDGNPSSQSAEYVGGATTWAALKGGTHASGRTLIETKADFQALADGTYNGGAPPTKLVGVAQVYHTLQQERGKYNDGDPPFGKPFNANVPTLATMARAALNVLDDHPEGFFLHVEGGAVDGANHDNQPARMIEEQTDFNNAVQAVIDWVETHSSWDETLIIVTADHETGLLWGPVSHGFAFEPLVNLGTGVMPGMRYNSDTHTNSLVPVFARGPGSELLAGLVDGTDPTYGDYVDNTDLFVVMDAVIPEPATVVLLGVGMGFPLKPIRR